MQGPDKDLVCPLCGGQTEFFHCDKTREYFRCPICQLVNVPSVYHLSDDDEKRIYDLHENSFEDEGYRHFLGRVIAPLCTYVSHGEGLDFGCGPAPVLAELLSSHGLPTAYYDKFYYPNEEVLDRSYRFVTLTEVIEHLREPRITLQSLWRLIQPSGVMVVMTKRWLSLERFSQWHYKNDPTHIVFFHTETFTWLAEQMEAELDVISNDIVILRKSITNPH